MPLRIEHWDVPFPKDPTFVRKVNRELARANTRALETLYPDGKGILRNPSKARNTHCKKCGVHCDELNPDCRVCKNRHNYRLNKGLRTPKTRKNGLPKVQIPGVQNYNNNQCKSCGIDRNQSTPGCKTCKSRHCMRRLAKEKRET